MAAHDPNTPQTSLALADPRRVATALVPSPPALSLTPDAFGLLKALRRRWLLAIGLGLLLALTTAAAAWFLLPARYNSFAVLQVSSRNPNSFIGSAEWRAEFPILMKTTAGRVKARDVLMRTLNNDQVRPLRLIRKHPDTLSALTWLEENMKVEFAENSELLTVGLTGEEPDDLVVLVNALVKSYLTILTKEEEGQRKNRLERAKLRHARGVEKLREKVNEKEDLLRSQGVKDAQSIQVRQMQINSRLQVAQEYLAQFKFELEKKNAHASYLKELKKTGDEGPPPAVAMKDLHDNDPYLKQMVDDVRKYEDRLRTLRASGHPENEFFVRVTRSRVASLRRMVDTRVAELRSQLAEKYKSRRAEEVDHALRNLGVEIEPLSGRVKQQEAKVETLTKDAAAVNYSTAKQNLLEGEIVQESKNLDKLFEEYKRAQMEVDAEPRITPIGEAELQTRDTKKRLFMLIFAPIAALVCTALAVSYWEFMARRIHGPDEVAAGLSIRVVGAVPELPDPRRRATADPQAEEIYRHNLVESIDAIRTMLLRNANQENLRVIMVTSALGGEGKTTLASNLAMSLARAGRKTLLMDCDLRRAAAHQLFEQTLQPGFSEAVLHEVELPDAVRPTTVDPNLYLLPAGHWDREVIQELAKSGTTAVFEKLRQEFDFIVVDSHPVLPATDSLLIGQHVDAVIVSLMRDVSQMHHAHAACQQLATLGIRVFGAVVNGVPVKVYEKDYQYAAQSAA